VASHGSQVSQQSIQDQDSSCRQDIDHSSDEGQSENSSAFTRRLLTVSRNDLKEWGVAALIFAVPWFLAVFWVVRGEIVLALPIVALIFGVIRRPRHLWGNWIASFVVVWVAIGAAALWAADPAESDPENQETIVSFLFESMLFTAFLVLLPLWIGRLVGHRLFGKHSNDTTPVARSE
jgi:hypothetical protein